MLDNYNKKQIEKISYELLRRSKAFDVFPTPVDGIIKQADLVVANNVDLSKVKHSFFERISDGAKNLIKDIRGVLDRQQRVIYLDMSVGQPRKNFVKLHETGHDLITWQPAIINCLDNDETLSVEYEEQFEAEANFFASLTLFQHDRFDREMNKLQLGIPAAQHLSKIFGSSIHAALRRLVERTSKKCALLVLEQPNYYITFTCKVRTYIQSSSFTSCFGELSWKKQLSYEDGWPFVEMYSYRKRFSLDGEVSIKDTFSKNQNLKFHYFNNSYNSFVLLFPDGENKATRTDIILTDF